MLQYKIILLLILIIITVFGSQCKNENPTPKIAPKKKDVLIELAPDHNFNEVNPQIFYKPHYIAMRLHTVIDNDIAIATVQPVDDIGKHYYTIAVDWNKKKCYLLREATFSNSVFSYKTGKIIKLALIKDGKKWLSIPDIPIHDSFYFSANFDQIFILSNKSKLILSKNKITDHGLIKIKELKIPHNHCYIFNKEKIYYDVKKEIHILDLNTLAVSVQTIDKFSPNQSYIFESHNIINYILKQFANNPLTEKEVGAIYPNTNIFCQNEAYFYMSEHYYEDSKIDGWVMVKQSKTKIDYFGLKGFGQYSESEKKILWDSMK